MSAPELVEFEAELERKGAEELDRAIEQLPSVAEEMIHLVRLGRTPTVDELGEIDEFRLQAEAQVRGSAPTR